ncbi:MAG: urease subunit beta [Cellulosilyticum sp.]|nr:urease subunit beta [Cellulosilyticum sp.]
MKIGDIISCNEEIELNADKHTTTITVTNKGDRPIQVGSHFHFFEVNKYLKFDRKEAFGYRLDIPSGTSVRFEPGEEKQVQLVALGGKQRVFGLNDLTRGQVSEATVTSCMHHAKLRGFMQEEEC